MCEYDMIWKELQNNGYIEEDCITYFDVVQVCEDLNINIDDIDIEKLSEKFNINIG